MLVPSGNTESGVVAICLEADDNHSGLYVPPEHPTVDHDHLALIEGTAYLEPV